MQESYLKSGQKEEKIMKLKFRLLFGSLSIIIGVLILYSYSTINKTYKMEEIPKDIESRIYKSAEGKKNVTNITIEEQRRIKNYLVFLYSYDYKNTGRSNNYAIYKEAGRGFKRNSAPLLSFKFKDSKHNTGLQYIMIDEYVFMLGIINDKEPDTYKIESGNTIITDKYEKGKFFIKEYPLGNPNEMKISPIISD
jgi:hypothetical protein